MLKKILAGVLSLSFALALSGSVPVAFAVALLDPEDAAAAGGGGSGGVPAADGASRDPNVLRVYYSESIGAGQKVYHVTHCLKTPLYAPLTCNRANMDLPAFSDQCKSKENLNPAKVRGCKGDGSIHMDEHSSQEKITPGIQNCPIADNQRLVYGYSYAVLDLPPDMLADSPGAEDHAIGKIVTVNEDSQPHGNNDILLNLVDDPEEARKEAAKPGLALTTKALYQANVCFSADLLEDSDGNPDTAKPQSENAAAVADILAQSGNFKTMIDDGCNNDNTHAAIGEISRSTSFDENPTFTCTIYERISGKSGTDLFARYTGALYRWGAGVGGIIAVFIIVLSGIQMIVGGGEQGAVDKAKERIMQSLLGLVILFLSALFLYTINPGFFS